MHVPNFAVVREDPELEVILARRAEARAARPPRCLVVASGGCTALTLASRFPEGEVTAFDVSEAQLAHARAKLAAVIAGDDDALGAFEDRRTSLTGCGAFEGLFRILREFVVEFCAPAPALRSFFVERQDDPAGRRALVAEWTASRYWPLAFELAFDDRLLHAMFGPEATRHAAPGSYPGYFQRAFERALARADAPTNPFLQHVLLGHYLSATAPSYLRATTFGPITWIRGTLTDVPDLGRYDVVSLSNVLDWTDDACAKAWAARLAEACPRGTVVLLRLLNDPRDLGAHFAPAFVRDEVLSAELLAADRSFFYDKIEVFART